MRGRKISRTLCAAAAFTAIILGVASCDPPKTAPPQGDTTVSETGADVAINGVKIVVPAGAVAAGTKVNAAFDDRVPKGVPIPDLKALAKGFKITLGEGLQPAKPLTVTVPVDQALLAAGQDAGSSVAMMVQSEGADAPDLVAATWDQAARTVTAQIPHLSWIWPVQLDIAPLINSVRDTLVQAWNVESPRPACADQPLKIGTITYSPISPPSAWLCLDQSNGSLVVRVTPNSPIPYIITTTPSSSSTSQPDMSVADAVSVAMSHWYTKANQAVIMPGAAADFTFAGTPSENIQLDLNQFPIMMLNAILAKLLDLGVGVVGSVPSQIIGGAGCLQQVMETTLASASFGAPSASANSLSAEVAADFIKSLLGCADTVLKLSSVGQVILAMLTAAPVFIATAALGIINEIMQASHIAHNASFTSTIIASSAPAPAPAANGNQYSGTIRGGIQLNGVPSPHMVNVKLSLPGDWSAKTNPAYGDTGIDIVNHGGEKRLSITFADDMNAPCPASAFKQLEDAPVNVSGVSSPPAGEHLVLQSRLFTKGPFVPQDFPLSLFVTLGYSPDPWDVNGTACPYHPHFQVGPVYGFLIQELGFNTEQEVADFMAGPNFKKLKDTMASLEVELAK